MPTKSGFRIGSILGIPIYLHASWLLIFGLITYSLGMQFTQSHPQWSSTQHWRVGVLTSLLFFVSFFWFGLVPRAFTQRSRHALQDTRSLHHAISFRRSCAHWPRAFKSNSGIQYRHSGSALKLLSLCFLFWCNSVVSL